MATSMKSSPHSKCSRPPRKSPRGRASARPRANPPAARPQPTRPAPSASAALPVDPRLTEGLALFNNRQFFQAHEVLEALWRETEGRPRDFYKGLIQAAVACYHWARGNPAGALSLYRSSNGYLRRYRPDFLGVDVDGFLARYAELFGWLRRHHLRYDPHLVPTIRWVTT